MLRKHLIALLLPLFLLTSCIKEVENDESATFIPQEGMNVILTNDGAPARGVLFTSGAPFGNHPVTMHTETKMYLYQNETLFDSLQYQPELNYFMGHKPLTPGSYRCSAYVNDSSFVAGSTIIPEILPITQYEIIPTEEVTGGVNDPFGSYSQLKITLPNPDKAPRYFHIKILKHTTYLRDGEITISECELVTQEDPVLVRENVQNEAIFSNSLMDEGAYELTLNFDEDIAAHTYNYASYTFYILVRFVSYDYYQYAKALYLREEESNADFFYPVFPTEMYSNVTPTGVVYGYASWVSDSIVAPFETQKNYNQ